MAGVSGAVVAVTLTIRGRSTSRSATCAALPRQQRCGDLGVIGRVSARNRHMATPVRRHATHSRGRGEASRGSAV